MVIALPRPGTTRNTQDIARCPVDDGYFCPGQPPNAAGVVARPAGAGAGGRPGSSATVLVVGPGLVAQSAGQPGGNLLRQPLGERTLLHLIG
jgi:hypothetical protein